MSRRPGLRSSRRIRGAGGTLSREIKREVQAELAVDAIPIVEVLRKDSLEISEADRAVIREALARAEAGLHDEAREDVDLAALLAGASPAVPRLDGTCYNTVAPGYAFSLFGTYQPKDDIFAEIEGSGFTSPVDAPRETRQREADIAQSWYHTITAETFG